MCTKKKKTNSCYCFYFQNNEKNVGVIQNFARLCNCNDFCNECKVYAIVNLCQIKPAVYCSSVNMYVPTIFVCCKSNLFDAVEIENLDVVCFTITVNNILYLISPINTQESE